MPSKGLDAVEPVDVYLGQSVPLGMVCPKIIISTASSAVAVAISTVTERDFGNERC